MKLICELSATYEDKFNMPEKTQSGHFLFYDKQASHFSIKSPILNPFGQKWTFLPSIQKNKGRQGKKWPGRLILRLMPLEKNSDGDECNFVRHQFKACFLFADGDPIAFYACPMILNQWVSYAFYV